MDSDSANNSIEKIFKGSKGTFTVAGTLGKGGNGIVYYVSFDEKGIQNLNICEGALKEFKVNKKSEKKFIRFKKEIEVMNEIGKVVDGILPILDYSLGTCSNPWYLMPKAKAYYSVGSFDKRIDDVFQLGKIIRGLHSKGYAHRDIKTQNILIYDKSIYLADYGLCWNENDTMHITSNDEAIGPFSIRPPELEAYRDDSGVDFRKSDVYLFAKTAWIILTKHKAGFTGEYNRKDQQIYLDCNRLDVDYTLEPLDEMMEGATKYFWKDRIDIDDCLNLLTIAKRFLAELLSINGVSYILFISPIRILPKHSSDLVNGHCKSRMKTEKCENPLQNPRKNVIFTPKLPKKTIFPIFCDFTCKSPSSFCNFSFKFTHGSVI